MLKDVNVTSFRGKLLTLMTSEEEEDRRRAASLEGRGKEAGNEISTEKSTTAASSTCSSSSDKRKDSEKDEHKSGKKDVGGEEEEEEAFCRVCRCRGTPSNPLRHPCKCKGSVKWIHEECLGEWLKRSKKYECELCGYKYSFKKEYTVDAPETLSASELASALLKKLGTVLLSLLSGLVPLFFGWVVDPLVLSWIMHMFLEIDFVIPTGKN